MPAAPAPIHFDARGIDHRVGDPARRERAMEPEAIAARFVAGDSQSVRREATMGFGTGHLAAEVAEIKARCSVGTAAATTGDRVAVVGITSPGRRGAYSGGPFSRAASAYIVSGRRVG